MKKVLKGLKEFFLCIWQLPQECVAFLLLLWFYSRGKIDNTLNYKFSTVFRSPGFRGGISLSRFIIVPKFNYTLIKHELGHSKQSRILGPLYLIVIGLPSLIWACIYKDTWKKSYYWFYTEAWADKLGGIITRD